MSITLNGWIDSTSPTSFKCDFSYWLIFKIEYAGDGTFSPEVPSFRVPDATLVVNLFGLEGEMNGTTVAISGTIGPDSVNITSPAGNAVVSGALANPIDKEYTISGSLTFEKV